MDNIRDRTKGNKVNAVILLAALLFSMTIVSAQMSTTSNPPSFRVQTWELTTILAILASFSVIAIAYMISKGLGIPALNGWARNEAYQLIAMAIVVCLLFSALQIENYIFESFGYSPTPAVPNPAISSAQTYLSSVRTYVGSVLISTYFLNGIIQMLNFKLELPETMFYNAVDFGKGMTAFTGAMSGIIKLSSGVFGTVLGLTTAQTIFLDFINRIAFTILLPIGLFLRVFSFSRGIGTFFIALAIAFYVVYPLTFLMNEKIVDQILGYQGAWQNILKARSLQSTENGWIYQMADSQIQPSNPFGASGFVDYYTRLFTSIVYYAASTANYTINTTFNPFTLLNEGAFAFVLFTVIPILDFVITLGISREIGSLLGADVSFGDLLKTL